MNYIVQTGNYTINHSVLALSVLRETLIKGAKLHMAREPPYCADSVDDSEKDSGTNYFKHFIQQSAKNFLSRTNVFFN